MNAPILRPHIQHSLGLVSTKARIDPGIPKTQDVNPFPRSEMAGESTEAEISMA